MKLITYSQIGFNHPSQANWSYGIYKVDFIDTDRNYCMSHTVKESFGGDSRWQEIVSRLFDITIIQTKGVFPIQKITGVRDMLNMEGEEFIIEVKAFVGDYKK